MKTEEKEILKYGKNIKLVKNIDDKSNYVYNAYDIGLNKMNQVREYFKMNLKE